MYLINPGAEDGTDADMGNFHRWRIVPYRIAMECVLKLPWPSTAEYRMMNKKKKSLSV